MKPQKIITIIIGSLIATIIFLACINFIFSPEDDKTVFDLIGSGIVSKDFGETETQSQSILNELQNTEAPIVKYNETTYSTGEVVSIKNLIKVKTAESDSFVDGESEDGFTVAILDILDTEGNSINPMTEEEGEEAEEIISEAYYNLEESTIIFNNKGVFRVRFNVYGSNGRYVTKEIKVPVEE